MNKLLILTIGISNSGKTYWAEQFCQEHKNVVNLNRDDLRANLHTKTGSILDYKFTKQKEQDVTLHQIKRANIASAKGLDIIVSDTNLNPKTRSTWEKWATEQSYTVLYKVFDTEPHVCIARSLKRDYTVKPSVINRQYKAFRDYMELPTYKIDGSKPKAVIFDVDGTLADMDGVRKPFDWDKVSLDSPRERVIMLAKMFKERGYKIIVMSGRDGVCYDDTYEWLKHMGIPFDELLMRACNDSREDAIIKEELFWNNVAYKYDVHLTVDDRNQMVDRWRAMGLECWQVQDGDF